MSSSCPSSALMHMYDNLLHVGCCCGCPPFAPTLCVVVGRAVCGVTAVLVVVVAVVAVSVALVVVVALTVIAVVVVVVVVVLSLVVAVG